MNKTLLIIIAASVALKVMLTFGVVKMWGLNWDESSAWKVAQNHIDGHGYALYDERTKQYKPTAFHGAFTVLLYEQLIRQGIPPKAWALFIHGISCLLFAVSVWYFYRLAALYIRDERLRTGATLTYAFYPSVQYYIGSLLLYENFAGSLLIIVLYYLLRPATEKFRRGLFVLLPMLIAVSCWFRPQLIIIYTVTLALLLLFSAQRKSILLVSVLACFLATAGFVPTLQKNKHLFGAYMLSTQLNFELLQGHNPHARGSWQHHWYDPGNPLYEYAHHNIPGLDTMNEYEEALARKKLAVDWALSHPGEELMLTLRKLAIFFMPYNFEELDAVYGLNAITGTVHLLFLFGTVWLLWKRRLKRPAIALYFPVIATVLLSLVFYFGCRWRFYAEPFMILVVWVFLNESMKELKN